MFPEVGRFDRNGMKRFSLIRKRTCRERKTIFEPFNAEVRICAWLDLRFEVNVLAFLEPVLACEVGGENGCLLRSGVHKHFRHAVHFSLLELNLLPSVRLQSVAGDVGAS